MYLYITAFLEFGYENAQTSKIVESYQRTVQLLSSVKSSSARVKSF